MSSIAIIANDPAHAKGNQLAHGNQRSAPFSSTELRKTAVAIYSTPLLKLFAFLTLSLFNSIPAVQALNAGWSLTGFSLLGLTVLLFIAGFEVAAAASGAEELF